MNEHSVRKVLKALGSVTGIVSSTGWLQVSCPFAPHRHRNGTDRRPSAGVKIEDHGPSVFSCYSCKTSGTLPKIVLELGKLRGHDYTELALAACEYDVAGGFRDYEDVHVYSPPEPIENEEIYAGMFPPAWGVEVARDYLEGRGVTQEAADHMELLFDPDQNRILFPVRGSEGELYGWTGRSIIEGVPLKIRDYKGLKKEMCLLGEYAIQKGKPLFVVEGLFSYAHLVSIGAREICNPVAIMGSHLSDYQKDLLISYCEPIYLCLDLDEAGEVGLVGRAGKPGAIEKLKDHATTLVALYPPDKDDVDKFTLQDVKEIIETHHELQH